VPAADLVIRAGGDLVIRAGGDLDLPAGDDLDLPAGEVVLTLLRANASICRRSIVQTRLETEAFAGPRPTWDVWSAAPINGVMR
jgi:hypothetical protein